MRIDYEVLNTQYDKFVEEYAGKMPGPSFHEMKPVFDEMMMDRKRVIAQINLGEREFEHDKEVTHGDVLDVLIFLIENKVNGWVTDEIVKYKKSRNNIFFKTVNGDEYYIANRPSISQRNMGEHIRLMKPVKVR